MKFESAIVQFITVFVYRVASDAAHRPVMAHEFLGVAEVGRRADVNPGAVNGEIYYFLPSGYGALYKVGCVSRDPGLNSVQQPV